MLPYPQSTFEALFVEAVDGREYLKELVNALLIIEVSELLKGLLDLLTKSLRLIEGAGERKKHFQVKPFWEKVGSEPRNAQETTDKAHCK